MIIKSPPCPICKGDRDRKFSAELHEAFVKLGGFRSEWMNPGGREVNFGNGSRIQLEDQCNNCDHEAIIAFAKAAK